jgi:hypothetical protein
LSIGLYPSSLYGLWWALSLFRYHKEKKGRYPNGQKRKGSSVAIKRRRTDNPMEKRENWVFCPSLYGLWWPLSLLSIGLSVLLLFMASDDPFLFCPLGCLSFSLWPLTFPHCIFNTMGKSQKP